MVRALLVLVLLILSSPAAAQSTRVESIAEEQKKKAGELGTEGIHPNGGKVFRARAVAREGYDYQPTWNVCPDGSVKNQYNDRRD